MRGAGELAAAAAAPALDAGAGVVSSVWGELAKGVSGLWEDAKDGASALWRGTREGAVWTARNPGEAAMGAVSGVGWLLQDAPREAVGALVKGRSPGGRR